MGRSSTSPAFAQISKPCHFISFLGTLHPPNICRANCAALVFFSCRVARSLAPSSLHSASSLGAHSPPGLPSRSRRRHVPPLHRGHGHDATLVTSLGPGRPGPRGNHLLLLRRDCLPNRLPPRDRPGRNASPQDLESITVRLPSGIGHGKGPCSATADLVSLKSSSCCGATACPTGSSNGTGLDATHPPRIWSVSPSDSLPGSVTARGHARLQPTWFPLKSSLSRPQWL